MKTSYMCWLLVPSAQYIWTDCDDGDRADCLGGDGADCLGGDGADCLGGDGADCRGGEGVDCRGGDDVDGHSTAIRLLRVVKGTSSSRSLSLSKASMHLFHPEKKKHSKYHKFYPADLKR